MVYSQNENRTIFVLNMENNSKKYLGKYLVTKWEHESGFVDKCLRRVNRVTKGGKYLVSNVQRTNKTYSEGVEFWQDDMGHVARWAQKFRVVEGEVVRSVTSLDNPNGVFEVEVLEDLDQLLCEYSYEELFQTDVRKFQSEGCNPRYWVCGLCEMVIESGNQPRKEAWYINPRKEHFFKEVNEFLKELFKVEEVLYFSDFYEKSDNQSILGKSATFFQITNFGGDKKIISRTENENNMPIQFWYFGDKLVWTKESGKITW